MHIHVYKYIERFTRMHIYTIYTHHRGPRIAWQHASQTGSSCETRRHLNRAVRNLGVLLGTASVLFDPRQVHIYI